MENYNKKSIWKWILLYILIAAVAYGLIYYFFFNKNGNNNYNSENPQRQTQNNSADYSKEIKGRFILKGSTQAGFNFIGNGKVIWQNELNTPSDELSILWLNNETFITKDTQRINETSPPRVNIYVVDGFDGKTLYLKEFWTGWGDFYSEGMEFTKVNS